MSFSPSESNKQRDQALASDRTQLSALLSWSVYNNGLKKTHDSMLDIGNLGDAHAVTREVTYPSGARVTLNAWAVNEVKLENSLWANKIAHLIRGGDIRVLPDEIINGFVPARVAEGNGHATTVSDGVVSIDGYNTCGFVESGKVGDKTLEIVFRGTELGIGKLRAIKKYFMDDYPRISKHYDELRPVVNAAIEYARANNMNVHFSGHSLGASMAQIAMSEHLDKKSLHGEFQPKFTATVFGSPGNKHVMEKMMRKIDQVMTRISDLVPGVQRNNELRKVIRSLNLWTLNLGIVALKEMSKHLSLFSLLKLNNQEGCRDKRINSFVHKHDPIPQLGAFINSQRGTIINIEGDHLMPDPIADNNKAEDGCFMKFTKLAKAGLGIMIKPLSEKVIDFGYHDME
jgi:hypothetical protein